MPTPAIEEDPSAPVGSDVATDGPGVAEIPARLATDEGGGYEESWYAALKERAEDGEQATGP